MSDINGPVGGSGSLPKAVTQNSSTAAAQDKNSTAAVAGHKSSSSDVVTLTPAAEHLQRLERAVAEADPIDHKKVEMVRQEIVEGRFSVNSQTVADKLIDLEKTLLSGRS